MSYINEVQYIGYVNGVQYIGEFCDVSHLNELIPSAFDGATTPYQFQIIFEVLFESALKLNFYHFAWENTGHLTNYDVPQG